MKKLNHLQTFEEHTTTGQITVDSKVVDMDTILLDGIDTKDYPDFADAYIMSAEFVDGTPLTHEQLEELQNKLGDEWVHEQAMQIAMGA